jgi:pre-mRNA-splicing helicase BRR2
LQALVDVISSQGWLRPALAAMEVSQMIVQGLWNKDSNLMQLPHFTPDVIERFGTLSEPVESVFDLIDMDDSERNAVLQCSADKLSDIAMFCNAYPNVELTYDLGGATEGEVTAGHSVVLRVKLTRETDDDITAEEINNLGKVVCPRYPEEKRECWWLIIGDPNNNTLLSIKRIALLKDAKVSS